MPASATREKSYVPENELSRTSPKLARFGFTLIEIIVVMAIIGVLSSAGFPSLMLFAQEMRVETEARAMLADLELLRSATMAAASGTGTIRFVHASRPHAPSIDGRSMRENPIVRYEIEDPSGELRRLSTTGTFSRDISSGAVCIGTWSYDLEIDPTNTDSGSILSFDCHGLASIATGVDFYVNYLRYENKSRWLPPTDPNVFFVASDTGIGSWVLRIASNTGLMSVQATGSARCY